MPYLTVIAGPNGAGKSTSSKLLLLERGITAFDFDKEFYDAWERFSFDPILENGIRESTGNKFLELRQKALIDKTNFSYETNFNTLEIIKTVNEFKEAGFTTELKFIALTTVGQCILRVKERVSNGGHAVDEQTIKDRFVDGFETLDKTFHLFGNFTLKLSINRSQKNLIHITRNERSSKIITIKNPLPPELREHLPLLTRYVNSQAQKRGGPSFLKWQV